MLFKGFIFIILFSAAAFSEVQNSVTMTSSTLYPGDVGTFSAASTVGPAGSANGTKTFTYSGLQKYGVGYGDGRYTSLISTTRYGVAFDVFEIFQSFLSTLYSSVISSGSTCPSATTYNWIGVRFRTPELRRNLQNSALSAFYGGGRLSYDPSASPKITGTNYVNLTGPSTVSSGSYSLASTGGCSSGSMSTTSTSSYTEIPFDAKGTMMFGNDTFAYLAKGGNPVLILGFASQNADASAMSSIANHVFSGLYTQYSSLSSQTRKKIFATPDASGTTFTLTESTSDTDPSLSSALGTLDCTNLDSPQTGFCNGTLTLNGVTGTGNALCAISTVNTSKILSCVAQRPDDTRLPISIVASVSPRAVLSVTLSGTAQVTNALDSTTVTATLQNLSGRAIPTIGNPGGVNDLTSPYSNTGAYAGSSHTGGPCGTSLKGYGSCTVTITYQPAAVGTHTQTFRVAYDNGSSTVNATASLVGTCGLTSVAIDQVRPGYAPNSSQAFTATATYSNGSTQNVTSVVTWASSDTAKATITSGGTASFFKKGSTTVSATLGSSSGTLSATVGDPTTLPTVLGQADADNISQAASSLSWPWGVAVAGTKLIVMDYIGNRGVVYNSLPTATGAVPDFAIGQPSLTSVRVNAGNMASGTFLAALGVSSDGTRVAANDRYSSRVQIWNTVPTAMNQPADIVLGASNFTTVSAATTSSGLNGPWSVYIGNSKVIVPDTNNNRVMIWNSIPTANGQAADLVLGQATFTTATSGTTSTSMSAPNSAYYDGTRLYVSDGSNNRVLVWNTFPTANGQAADLALGQSTLTTGTANLGGSISASTLSTPWNVTGTGTKVFVSDLSNHRVLLWNTAPTASGQPADVVIGQANATTGSATVSSTRMNGPRGVATDGTKLYIADTGNNRVLGYSTIPTATGAAADFGIGNQGLTLSWSYGSTNVTSQTMRAPYSIHSDGNKFAVVDTGYSRVLFWNSIPTTNQPADYAIGQANLTSAASSLTANGMSTPNSVFLTGQKVLVADQGYHRVLIYNSYPTASGPTADLVLGQANMTSSSVNGGGSVSASGFSTGRGIYYDGTHVLLSDYGNNRVLIWNSMPTANNQAADLVLGQANFTSSSAGTTAQTLRLPHGTWSDGTRMMVADTGNNRVLLWNSFPTANGQAADLVLGQANMTSLAAATSSTVMQAPQHAIFDGNRLYVSDYTNRRILVWNSWPTANGQVANSVIGQLAFTQAYASIGTSGTTKAPTGTLLAQALGLYSDGVNLYFTDYIAPRVVSVTPSSGFYASLALSDGPTYAFGASVINTTYNKTITVSNSGTLTATNLAAGPTALSAPFYYKGGTYPGTGGTCGTSLAGGASCTVVISFRPTVSGSPTGTLELQYSSGNGATSTSTASIALSGSVTTTALSISSSGGYSYGTVSASTDHSFTITNSGGTTATQLWSTAPALAAPFLFKGGYYPGIGGTCTSQLTGGSTCTIVVTFTPTAAGSYSDTVHLSYKDGDGSDQTLDVDVSGSR